MKRKGYLWLTALCAFSTASMTVCAEEGTPSIATTSVAIAEILDLFGYENVIGVPETSGSLPDRYKEVQTIGGAMSPDLEILKSISPDLVLSPNSLEASLAGQYTAAGLEAMFMNMSSVQGLYDPINPEDMLLKNPDKIFIFAHYNEEEAFAAMEEDLATNSTWQYYDAVKNDQVYYLSSELFGMSATMKWTDAVEYLRPIFYGES